MRKMLFATVTMVAAGAVPVALLLAQEQKQTDEKSAKTWRDAQVEVRIERKQGVGDEKAEKTIQLRVLREEGKDGEGRPQLRVIVEDPSKPAEKETYIGLAIEPVPPVLAAQLPDVLAKDQGLVVTDMAADSPAAKAGLKVHDILVSYGDQKIFAPDQLQKLVRGDKPGQEAKLGIVRGGKVQHVTVTLGEREAAAGVRVFTAPGKKEIEEQMKRWTAPHSKEIEEQMKEQMKRWFDSRRGPGPGALRWRLELPDDEKADTPKAKTRFLSMTLKSLDGERYGAAIEYKDESGQTKKWSFEGTREEIRKELESNQELPEHIRRQMMRSLDGGGSFHFTVPPFGGFHMPHDGEDFQWQFPPGFERMFEDLGKQFEEFGKELDPQIREQLKGRFRSIEPPAPSKKPVVRDPV